MQSVSIWQADKKTCRLIIINIRHFINLLRKLFFNNCVTIDITAPSERRTLAGKNFGGQK